MQCDLLLLFPALAACIDQMIVITFTSGVSSANSNGNFHLEIRVNGVTYVAEFGASEKSISGGNLWKFNTSTDFQGLPSCVTKQDIEEIAIEEYTNDAWNIQSVLTVAKAGKDYELATVDMDVSQWIDGDESFPTALRRFELNLVM